MKRTVFDKQGKSYEVEAADAREYIACGEYFHSLDDIPKAAEPEAVAPVEPEAPAVEMATAAKRNNK